MSFALACRCGAVVARGNRLGLQRFDFARPSGHSGIGLATGSVSRVLAARAPRRGFIVRTLQDVEESGNVVKAGTGTWESRRYLLRKDGCGFSFHHTVLHEGQSTLIWYRNHVEAVFIIKGSGTIELVEEHQCQGEGTTFGLTAGTMYCLNGNERHFLRASDHEDMEAICTFSPPIAGTEDHDKHGVYPAVDDHGVSHYEFGPAEVCRLFPVPSALLHGSIQQSSRTAASRSGGSCDGLVLRHPTKSDGARIAQLAKRTSLDENSTYAYLLAATDFADCSLVAEENDRLKGFVFGYRPPQRPKSLFVWQVGVDPEAVGRGLGGKMLDALVAQPANKDVDTLEATVTPTNTASRALFQSFATRRHARMKVTVGEFAQDDFACGDGALHEREDRIEIGPL